MNADETRLKSSGFTIIEVLIVLAMAGLIMMIVFLAVPTLQKSGRNNQRKQDVSAILSAVSQFQLNHTGNMPTSTELSDFLGHYGNLTIYAPANVTSNSLSPGATANYTPAIDTVAIFNYQKCNTDNLGGSTHQGAGFTDVVARYAVEGSNGSPIALCKEL